MQPIHNSWQIAISTGAFEVAAAAEACFDDVHDAVMESGVAQFVPKLLAKVQSLQCVCVLEPPVALSKVRRGYAASAQAPSSPYARIGKLIG